MVAEKPSMLSTGEAAAAIGCTRQHIGNLIRSGRLEGLNISPGVRTTYRIPSDSLARYIVERNS